MDTQPKWQRVATTVALSVVGLMAVVVVAAPQSLSFHSLADWGRDSLGLPGDWRFVVPLALDAVGMAYAGLAFHASLKGQSAGAARLMVWVIAGASSVANWRQGISISTDAAVFSAAMPLSAALLLEFMLRAIRRTVLGHIGALEPPLPHYRAVRWVVDPLPTWRAWRTAVKEGLTDPADALELSRTDPAERLELVRLLRAQRGQQTPLQALLSGSQPLELPAPLEAAPEPPTDLWEGVPADLASWKKRDAVVLAFDRIADAEGIPVADVEGLGGKAHTWLAVRGITVNSNYAYDIARAARDQALEPDDDRPALAAVGA